MATTGDGVAVLPSFRERTWELYEQFDGDEERLQAQLSEELRTDAALRDAFVAWQEVEGIGRAIMECRKRRRRLAEAQARASGVPVPSIFDGQVARPQMRGRVEMGRGLLETWLLPHVNVVYGDATRADLRRSVELASAQARTNVASIRFCLLTLKAMEGATDAAPVRAVVTEEDAVALLAKAEKQAGRITDEHLSA